MTRTELIERLEAAEGPSRRLFEQAYRSVFGRAPDSETDHQGHADWWREYGRFDGLLDVQAWEQAALMLVPKGWSLALAITPGTAAAGFSKEVGQRAKLDGESQSPALAIVIAALKAQGTEDE